MRGMRTATIASAIILLAGVCGTHATEAPSLQGTDPSRPLREQATSLDAFGYLGGILEARFYEPHATTGEPREEIRQAALLYGVDLPMMLSIAKVESDFNPRVRTGSYKGLFQLSDGEFAKYGDGSIWDARDNARAAAHMFLVQAERFKDAMGHFPDYAERYMVHQQGIEGAIEHYQHPERVAWQSMCATSEGLLKGEQWCRRCIWGNLLPQWKRAFGSVEKISSADFVTAWTGRINFLANRYAGAKEPSVTDSIDVTSSSGVTSVTSSTGSTIQINPMRSSAERFHFRATARRNILVVRRVAGWHGRAAPASASASPLANAGRLVSRASAPANSTATPIKPILVVATAAPQRRRGPIAGLHRPLRQASAISR
jgi:hypothetical protein